MEVAKVLRVIDPLIEQVVQDIVAVEPTCETLTVLSVVL
jgi:ABC-type bacteriocin/lantibiotic exporter with double-glycine peptidase domain